MTVRSVLPGENLLNALLTSLDQVITRSDYETCTAVNRPEQGNTPSGGKQNEMSYANGPGNGQINNPNNFPFETNPTLGVWSK